MKAWFGLAAALIAATGAASAGGKVGTAYPPMQAFENIAGKSVRGQWQDPDGKQVVDFATYEYILGGKALQATHRIENSQYGGRTIFFYDEAAKNYVFHYFTTGGFHTTGTATFDGGVFAAVEKVTGHPEIAEVLSKTTFGPDEMRVVVNYVTKSGEQAQDVLRVYKPVRKSPRLF